MSTHDWFSSKRDIVLGYRFDVLRFLTVQAREDAEDESDPDRQAEYHKLGDALNALYGVILRAFSTGALEEDSSLTVGEYLAAPDPEGAEKAAGAVNRAAFALVALEEATE